MLNKDGIVQSVHFSKANWTVASSFKKLKELGYIPLKPVHETPHMYEYRIIEPKTFNHYATLKRRNGIQIILGFTKPKPKSTKIKK